MGDCKVCGPHAFSASNLRDSFTDTPTYDTLCKKLLLRCDTLRNFPRTQLPHRCEIWFSYHMGVAYFRYISLSLIAQVFN